MIQFSKGTILGFMIGFALAMVLNAGLFYPKLMEIEEVFTKVEKKLDQVGKWQ